MYCFILSQEQKTSTLLLCISLNVFNSFIISHLLIIMILAPLISIAFINLSIFNQLHCLLRPVVAPYSSPITPRVLIL